VPTHPTMAVHALSAAHGLGAKGRNEGSGRGVTFDTSCNTDRPARYVALAYDLGDVRLSEAEAVAKPGRVTPEDREALYSAVYAQSARLFHVESLRITRLTAETGEQVPEF